MQLRSQDLPPAYVLNGGFYLVEPEDFRRRRSLHSDGMLPLIMSDPGESVDIDTEWDWKMAEAIVALKGLDSR